MFSDLQSFDTESDKSCAPNHFCVFWELLLELEVVYIFSSSKQIATDLLNNLCHTRPSPKRKNQGGWLAIALASSKLLVSWDAASKTAREKNKKRASSRSAFFLFFRAPFFCTSPQLTERLKEAIVAQAQYLLNRCR